MDKKYNADTLYKNTIEEIVTFQFDEHVANVFPDMLHRSIPGYAFIISQIGVFAKTALQDNSHVYDLGCSLGAASLVIANSTPKKHCKIFGIDCSSAMIERAKKHIIDTPLLNPIEYICEDIETTILENASMVVLNFTLQFIPPERRLSIIKHIYNALRPQGILVVSEKIKYDTQNKQNRLNLLHHAFKQANGYSELEISQKRQAIENFLISETTTTHEERFEQAGFTAFDQWFQGYQFASWVAQK